MDFVEWMVEVSGIALGCFLLGFCGSLGMVLAFWCGSRLFEDSNDGVIGH
jgi:hypothetical protein